ncbi:OB-fold nucleic acid binding domain-containing protein [Staphylothermus hellenicus]|uniref:Nucleic acid binding OB-fold tRNA/helicase-type n=1 Tax=Staphylothermus hellenicus (strain DSM 12710 / JCM 10830 / BK20S6-10-b1 / P8) TaxID=591019 RepID=D7D8N7_STAHD|nr:OB-fold nucleic acid binding domain-containing protein [Staphylothermus hellenicus]ADI32133.1 nucleic acid binding OB-fold tRNA/helicase-type [Staphylothermus hellenicus DSM 12710]
MSEKSDIINSSSSPKKNIIDLKDGEEGVHITARVLETSPPKVIQTRKGPRTISNAVLGDETGRVNATLWGSKAGTLEEDKVVDIKGAWTTSYRGKVQINIGRSTEVSEVDYKEVPSAEEIPEDQPTAPNTRGFGSRRRGFYRQGRGIYRRK